MSAVMARWDSAVLGAIQGQRLRPLWECRNKTEGDNGALSKPHRSDEEPRHLERYEGEGCLCCAASALWLGGGGTKGEAERFDSGMGLLGASRWGGSFAIDVD